MKDKSTLLIIYTWGMIIGMICIGCIWLLFGGCYCPEEAIRHEPQEQVYLYVDIDDLHILNDSDIAKLNYIGFCL